MASSTCSRRCVAAAPYVPAHGTGLLRELALLVEAGLTPMAALTAATSTTADRFGLTDRGRIVPGLRADLLLVDADPTTDITTINKIAGVWRGGVRALRPLVTFLSRGGS